MVDEDHLMRVLRTFRHQMLVRAAWMQALKISSEKETLQQLSHLAETVIVAARDWLYQQYSQSWGTPCDSEGNPQPLLVLGMGNWVVESLIFPLISI